MEEAQTFDNLVFVSGSPYASAPSESQNRKKGTRERGGSSMWKVKKHLSKILKKALLKCLHIVRKKGVRERDGRWFAQT